MTKQDKGNVIDWLNEIISDPENWHRFYSDAEVKSLAEQAKMIAEGYNEAFDTLMQSYHIMNEYVMKNVTSRSD